VTYAQELLESARKLLREQDGGPTKASDCNRAISTAYYALFDCICTTVADRVAGKPLDHRNPSAPWLRVYRSFDHKFVRDTLVRATQAVENEANPFSTIATIFNRLMDAREFADYDRGKDFDVDAVLVKIFEAQFAVEVVENASNNSAEEALLSHIIVELLILKPKR
jgi:uncharacterized protein (UPF0332 family)